MENEIYDLLYMDSKEVYIILWRDMKQFWPDAVLEDASDFIHQNRFSITLPGIGLEEYLIAALNNGFFDCSLNWGLFRMEDPDKAIAMMKTVVAYKESKNDTT